ncbi:alkaline phosphatase D family protein [Sphingomonas donggukensis]|uniref:Alkaline phosphatase D family protein n=1 Tax=Sphingomonas donggukensis TaxID=2949093 RepID=A0ABY4TT07_9SPHN|nr:alkaline phosphatase D family protein [Sphingomonas donggukensis]URW74965.1 alkaline phosphatase D family protein [Sphingomonas donggukensis]
MTLTLDRRQLIVTGTLGLAALSFPGIALAQGLTRTGFTHNVASGEPGATSMLLWTRYVPVSGDVATIRVELSEAPDFARIAGGAEMTTGPWRDHTIKLTVTGLKPGTRYHYRFIAPDGTLSPVGRTKTLPTTARRLKIAVFSCSNIGFGWFGAYGHAAAGDCDLAYHLGDYFYEYGPGTYPVKAEMVDGRDMAPDHEALSLADYRLRYASYRADPDLQALHAAMPMLVAMDDHESANNSWEGGAQNHQSATEGAWSLRKAAAIQAWREWMPVSDLPYASYDVGGLATIYRTDTRLAARSAELVVTAAMRSDPAALRRFREGAWRDPARTMMGSTQEAWLAAAMAASARAGRGWQIVGFGTNMGYLQTPEDALNWLPPTAPEWARTGISDRVTLGRANLPQDMDSWGGFPAARARFLAAAQGLAADTIVLSGDSHNAWSFQLATGGRAAAVEFGVQSVTSGGIEGATRGVDPARIARSLVAGNRELAWCDTSRRGYMVTTLTPERATNEWLFWDSVATRSLTPTGAKIATVARGTRRIAV